MNGGTEKTAGTSLRLVRPTNLIRRTQTYMITTFRVETMTHGTGAEFYVVMALGGGLFAGGDVAVVALHDSGPFFQGQFFGFVLQQSGNVVDNRVAQSSLRVHAHQQIAIMNQISFAGGTHQDVFDFFVIK